MQRDVLGTLMLGLLAGHRRYAHIAALRGDAVAAQVLCMDKRPAKTPCAVRWNASELHTFWVGNCERRSGTALIRR